MFLQKKILYFTSKYELPVYEQRALAPSMSDQRCDRGAKEGAGGMTQFWRAGFGRVGLVSFSKGRLGEAAVNETEKRKERNGIPVPYRPSRVEVDSPTFGEESGFSCISSTTRLGEDGEGRCARVPDGTRSSVTGWQGRGIVPFREIKEKRNPREGDIAR